MEKIVLFTPRTIPKHVVGVARYCNEIFLDDQQTLNKTDLDLKKNAFDVLFVYV